MAVQCWTVFDSLMEWFQLFCVTYLPTASHQVSAQEKIYGFEDDVWRFPEKLLSARQALICKLDDWNYFWVSMLLEAYK